MAAKPITPSTSSRPSGRPGPIDARTQRFIRAAMIWHALIPVAALGGVAAVWLVRAEEGFWPRIAMTAGLIGLGVSSAAAIFHLARFQHRGRVISLIVTYLVFLFCFVGLLNRLGVFLGIDALAGTFPRGLPFMGLAVIGYLVRAFGDRFEETAPRRHKAFRRVGNAIMAAAVVLFLLAIGSISGLIALLLRLFDGMALGLLLGSVLSGIILWMMWRAPTARALNATITQTEMLDGLLFLSPNLLGFLFFFAGPLLFSLYVSFTNWDAFGAKEWVGLSNYGVIFHLAVAPLSSAGQPFNTVMDVGIFDELFRFDLFGQHWVVGAEDKLFWISLGNTLLFGLMAVPLSVAPALVLANILNTKTRGMTFFRAVYFLPTVAAVVGVALVWRWLYNATVGWINYFIATAIAGVNGLLNTGIANPQIGWLSDTNVALLAVVIVAAWQWLGFNTVLFLAGLQDISRDLYEAAIVDGAGAWDRFWKITLPMLAPTTFFVVSTTTINAAQIFDQVFVLTNPPGGPGTSTMSTVLYLYRNGFQNFRQGYASAIAWVLFLLIFGLTLIQFQRQRGTMAYDE